MTRTRTKALAAALDRLFAVCLGRGLRIATAESCTGGLVAAAITGRSGASTIFDCGFVTYENAVKIKLLGVPAEILASEGAVSEAVAVAMAQGAAARAPADAAVGITGIAGPGGGTAEKPVGLVWIAAVRQGGPTLAERHVFPGDRTAIRDAAAIRAIELLAEVCDSG